jgi:Zn-dependent M28 family amino/carboxypeptidase
LRRVPVLVAAILPLVSLGSCGRTAQAAFDGKRAYDWIVRQCDLGPRVPGTATHDSCFALLAGTLRQYAPVVETDTFLYDSPELGREVRLLNVVARFRPQEKTRILIGAHWDTRPWADAEKDAALHRRPILGANDGASGVAVLLELARCLKSSRPALGVDLVLLDGEDLGTEGNPSGFFRGSQRYVERLGENRPIFFILVDMVGRKNASFYWEGNSHDQAPNIVDLVWNEASSMGVRSFLPGVKYHVYDDHIPFLNAGIPAIDVIDFGFPEWHTLKDTPAICSPATLEGVGRVLLSLSTRASYLSR